MRYKHGLRGQEQLPTTKPGPGTLGSANTSADICTDRLRYLDIRPSTGDCPKCSEPLRLLNPPAGERDGVSRCQSCETIVLLDGVARPARETVEDLMIRLSLSQSYNNMYTQ